MRERMKVLVACEESQAVTQEMRRLGHEAYSCDIEEPSGGHPEWHIHGDCTPYLDGNCKFYDMWGGWHEVRGQWDLLIGHPPCTYLTNASAVRMVHGSRIVEERYQKMLLARDFFLRILNADCAHICVENPAPMGLTRLPPYSQIIEPWMFGHPYSKRTCLWLKNLPELQPTQVIRSGITPWVNGGIKDRNGKYKRYPGRNERNQKQRSKTFAGIARAMAEQWANAEVLGTVQLSMLD